MLAFSIDNVTWSCNNGSCRTRRMLWIVGVLLTLTTAFFQLSVQNHTNKNLGTTSKSHVISIPLNKKAAPSWGEDIISIQHFPEDQEIVVIFAPYARCPRPYLMGRLSGPALILLENWTFQGVIGPNAGPAAATSTYTTSQSTMTGKYNVPIGGLYFLEILGLFCEDYSYHLKQNDTLANWMASKQGELFLNYDLRGVCVEDLRTNRLTTEEATIQINRDVVHAQNHSSAYSSYWLHKDASTSNSTFEPVSTRWQPAECFVNRQTGGPTTAECEAKISLDRFQSYSFQWRAPDLADLLSQHPQASFCMVGASHARGLVIAGQTVFENTNITFNQVETKYPNDATQDYILQTSKAFDFNCTHYIVATGQWPGSFDDAHPLSWAEWEKGITHMIQRFQNFTSNFYLRSIHYNPLGSPIQFCPPIDWRHPMLLDGYNSILEELCRKMGVKYLDTRWMDGAIWDIAPDWCHLPPEVNKIQILYLVAASLGYDW